MWKDKHFFLVFIYGNIYIRTAPTYIVTKHSVYKHTTQTWTLKTFYTLNFKDNIEQINRGIQLVFYSSSGDIY